MKLISSIKNEVIEALKESFEYTSDARKNMTPERKEIMANLWVEINRQEMFLILLFFIPYSIMEI